MSGHACDVVVIGAGPAGEVAAGRAADHGLSVVIVEAELVGGECSYWACIPSKALLRPAQALDEARRVPGAREAASGALDVAAVLERRDEVVHDHDDAGQLPWLEERGVRLVRGTGRLDGERRVRVEPGGEVLEARVAVILATGTTTELPPVEGLEAARPWTNREATAATAAPARLAVLGGGPVGCELAQAWATLGSEVTLLEAAPRLLAREEPLAAEAVAAGLRAAGVTVRTGVTVTSAARQAGGVRLEVNGGAPVTADEVLVAAGRRVRSGDLGLETAGIDVEAGRPIEVGPDLAVPGAPWLSVIGDANGLAALTHEGKYQARLVADRLGGLDPGAPRAAVTGPRSPRAVFTEPQVAAVGHTEASAREAGIAVRAVDADAGATAGGSFVGRGADAPCRVLVDDAHGVLVGATFVGPEIEPLLHAATIAIACAIPVSALQHAVPAFPTRSEVWLGLVDGALRAP